MEEKARFSDLDQLFNCLCENEGAIVEYESGEVIYKQDQPDNRVYRVKSGGVAQSKRGKSGDLMTYQILVPGSIFSTYHLSEDAINQPCMAKALLDSQLQQVLRDSFKRYLLQNPRLALKIADIISEELQNRDKTLERQIYMTAKERILSVLRDLSPLGKEVGEGKLIDFLTRKELADMAGMTEETATRSLTKLEEEGKLKKSSGGIVLV